MKIYISTEHYGEYWYYGIGMFLKKIHSGFYEFEIALLVFTVTLEIRNCE